LSALRAATVPEALMFLDGLTELHQRYWNSRGQPGGFSFQFFASFQRSLIQTCLPHGTVEIVKVAAGDHIIGYVYNMVYRGYVYAYQTGFNYESDARLKPGLVSHALCIEQHLRDGSAVYDFLAGEHRYKASLGARGPDLIYLLVERPTLALLAETKLYDARLKLGAVWQQLRRTQRGDVSSPARSVSDADP
jgi:CelD/BcsL family acetyltransferase involved in cellulose biosynthesis